MKTLTIKLRQSVDRSYPIFLGQGIFGRLVRDLKEKPLGRKYAVISDRRVMGLYGEKLLAELCMKGIDACAFYFAEGEASKRAAVWLGVSQEMVEQGFERGDCVIALGGGVVGDLAGFVAATFMRGIPWLQVPTSLLAMADASIGGKVAIDLASGKNLLGAFWQPGAVYIDLDLLKTLPSAHRLNGMAEMVKSGLVRDPELFALLERNGREMLAGNTSRLQQAMMRSLWVKARVVEKDEREISGERKILNYGHTIGHGLEAVSGYRLLHGFAVALGMRAAARIAREMGILSERDRSRQNKLLDRLGFPQTLPRKMSRKILSGSGQTRLLKLILKDKKARAGSVEMVLLCGIGRVQKHRGQWTVPVDEQMLRLGLEEISG
jgi:3-dehydroquinate synthase